MTIHVEIFIRAGIDDVWRCTQTPDLHARWDLRFTDIEYLPRPDPLQPQRFLYATRIGFGLHIEGEGESVATREDASGVRTSSLRFWSDDPKSLIRIGSGYWQYVPVDGGVRFLTRYTYETRFGPLGRAFNALVFEPLLGWATAWSFDRLRLWLEEGLDPASSFTFAGIHALARVTLAVAWLYHGIVPKFLFPDSGELDLLRRTGIFGRASPVALRAMGVAEIAFAIALLAVWHSPRPLFANTIALLALTVGAIRSSPGLLRQPFNPITLNLSMAALGVLGLLAERRMPTASRCLRRP